MLNKISFYHLDNLINNRVPFMFYNMSQSLSSWYFSVNKMHVDNYQILITSTEVIADIKFKKVPQDYAIVLLCNDGQTSLKLFTELDQMAYTNVYVIDGGYQQIVTEREQI